MKLNLRIKRIHFRESDYTDLIQILEENTVSFIIEKDVVEVFFKTSYSLSDKFFQYLSKELTKIDCITFHKKHEASGHRETPFLDLDEFILKDDDVRFSLGYLELLLIKLNIKTNLIEKGRDRLLLVDLRNHVFKTYDEKRKFEVILEGSLKSVYKIL